MQQAETPNNPAFLDYVYELTGQADLTLLLQESLEEIDRIDLDQLNTIGLQTYQPGKWSIHKIIQHLIDWERIWCFRAVTLARKEGTIPVGLDEEIMGHNSNADEIPLEQLIEELRIVRQSTIMMFRSFNSDMLEMTCTFFEYEMPLSAIGHTIVAHQIHHLKVITERYLPLAP